MQPLLNSVGRGKHLPRAILEILREVGWAHVKGSSLFGEYREKQTARFYTVPFTWEDPSMLHVMSWLCVISTAQRAFIADLLTQSVEGALRCIYHTYRRQEWPWLLVWKALSTGLWRWKEPDTDTGAVCRPLCISVLAQWLGCPIMRTRKAEPVFDSMLSFSISTECLYA